MNNYFDNNPLGELIWNKKYKDKDENSVYDRYDTIVSEIIRIMSQRTHKEVIHDKNDLSEYGQKRKELSFDQLSSIFKEKLFTYAGSPTALIGTKQIGSLSNCYGVASPRDSYVGIIERDAELANIMKRRGGVGINLSTLRPEGATVNNAAKTSTGVISFAERYSRTTNEVAQNGRRGKQNVPQNYVNL